LLVLSAKIFPSSIEGTFLALLKAIDKVGLLSSSWGGGLLLHLLIVTHTDFRNLWLVIMIMTIMTISPLVMLFLVVPKKHQSSTLIPSELIPSSETTYIHEEETIQLVPIVKSNQVLVLLIT